jgi:selenide,water dikinase
MDGVHAVTDVTGFGLAGHLLEICRGSGLAAEVDFERLPLIEEAAAHVRAGIATGASARNWSGYGSQVVLPEGWEPWRQAMITDPQTSGGLLVACAPECVPAVLDCFTREGFAQAAEIGRLEVGEPRLRLI